MKVTQRSLAGGGDEQVSFLDVNSPKVIDLLASRFQLTCPAVPHADSSIAQGETPAWVQHAADLVNAAAHGLGAASSEDEEARQQLYAGAVLEDEQAGEIAWPSSVDLDPGLRASTSAAESLAAVQLDAALHAQHLPLPQTDYSASTQGPGTGEVGHDSSSMLPSPPHVPAMPIRQWHLAMACRPPADDHTALGSSSFSASIWSAAVAAAVACTSPSAAAAAALPYDPSAAAGTAGVVTHGSLDNDGSLLVHLALTLSSSLRTGLTHGSVNRLASCCLDSVCTSSHVVSWITA